MIEFACSSSVPGLPVGYRIYRDGRVTSLASGHERMLSSHIARTGYRAVGLKHNGRTVVHLVHRLLALCFLPNADGKPQVNHIDGDKLNNSLGNLEWCTDAENKRHAYSIGLMPRSTDRQREARHKLADKMIAARRRFSDHDMAAIRYARQNGASCRSIGQSYGCSHSIISRICTNQSYVRRLGDQ